MKIPHAHANPHPHPHPHPHQYRQISRSRVEGGRKERSNGGSEENAA